MSSFAIEADIGDALELFDALGSAAKDGIVRPVAQAGAQAQGNQQGSNVTGDMGPRTSIAGGAG